jgi:hypothetical protein
MPLRGPQLAYYIKKRDPELYKKAKEVKDRYNVTWDEAFAIVRGEEVPPTQSAAGGGVQSALDDVVRRVEALEGRVDELVKLYTDLITTVNILSIGLSRRFKFEDYYCVSMDSEGYCRAFYWRVPLKGYKVEEVVEGGERRYYVNVKEHKWVCALCPAYTPKHVVSKHSKP